MNKLETEKFEKIIESTLTKLCERRPKDPIKFFILHLYKSMDISFRTKYASDIQRFLDQSTPAKESESNVVKGDLKGIASSPIREVSDS